MILVRTNYPCFRVGCHRGPGRLGRARLAALAGSVVAVVATVASVVLAIGVILGRVVDGRSIEEDVFDEFVAFQQNLIAPAGIACRRRIQNSQDKRVNVLYPADLRVEHGNSGSINPGGRGGDALEEEAVVDASCRATVVTSASMVVAEAYSSSRRRVMARTQA
jgi:hypothetical protein